MPKPRMQGQTFPIGMAYSWRNPGIGKPDVYLWKILGLVEKKNYRRGDTLLASFHLWKQWKNL